MTEDPSEAPPRPGTSDPRRSRERALKVLFQADLRGVEPIAVLRRIASDPSSLDLLDATGSDDADATGAPPLDGYSRSLVLGVGDHLGELDALLDEHAEGWTVTRMPVVDRNILRLGAYELLHEDTPAAVVISEAVAFAKRLSTARSHRFVNGVLEAVRRAHNETDAPSSGPAGVSDDETDAPSSGAGGGA